MIVFEKSTLIKCSQEELFDFHLDVNNLTKITPPDIDVELLTPSFTPKEGETMKIKSTKHFIPLNWTVQITKLERPSTLIDLAIKSPFKYWQHQHLFINHKNFTELKDIVTYELPFGLMGAVLKPFIYKDLLKMFSYRHEITKEILEKKGQI